jgi:hypothetical protein
VTGYVKDFSGLFKNRLGAIAVMNIEIKNGNPFQTVCDQGVSGGYRHVVEQAESHRTTAFSVVTGRPGSAEGIPGLTSEYLVYGKTSGPAATQSRID